MGIIGGRNFSLNCRYGDALLSKKSGKKTARRASAFRRDTSEYAAVSQLTKHRRSFTCSETQPVDPNIYDTPCNHLLLTGNKGRSGKKGNQVCIARKILFLLA